LLSMANIMQNDVEQREAQEIYIRIKVLKQGHPVNIKHDA